MRRLSDIFAPYRSLPKPIWALAFARMVNTMGAFVHPFLALLLTDRLGYGVEAAGRTIMIVAAMTVPGALIGGKIADGVGRKKILVASQALGAVGLFVCGFLGDSPTIIGFLMAQQFFMGMMMPASSSIAFDITRPENRKGAFSLLYLGLNIGFAVGPLMAGMLYENHTRWLFWGDAATSILSVFILIAFVPETIGEARRENRAGTAEAAERGSLIRVLLRRPRLVVFVSLIMISWFVYAQSDFTLPLAAKDLFPSTGAVLFGRLRALNAVVVTLLTVPIIASTRRYRPINLVAAQSLFYAAGFGMLAYVNRPGGFYISTFIWTVGEILGATNYQVYIANHTPSSHRGRFNAVLPLIMGTGRGMAPWLAGVFIAANSLRSVWGFTALLAVIAAAGTAMLGFSEHRNTGTRGTRDRRDPGPGETG